MQTRLRHCVGMTAILMVIMLVHPWTPGTALLGTAAHHLTTVAPYADHTHAPSPKSPSEVVTTAHVHGDRWSIDTPPTCHDAPTRTGRLLAHAPPASPADSNAVHAAPTHPSLSSAHHRPRTARQLAVLAVQRC